MTLSKQDHRAASKCGLRNFKRNDIADYIMNRLFAIGTVIFISYVIFAPWGIA